MNRGRGHALGFTVVETMIFLAVSGLMFIMAMRFLGGQQANNEFKTAVSDAQSKIESIVNNVATGYYQNPGTLSCSADPAGGKPVPSGGSGDIGTQKDCVFIGRVIQLAPDDERGDLNVYSAVGRKLKAGSVNSATSLSEAMPVLIAKAADTDPAALDDAVEHANLGGDLQIKKLLVDDGAGYQSRLVGMIGFFGSLDQANGAVNSTGQMRVDAVTTKAQAATNFDTTQLEFVQAVNGLDYSDAGTTNINPKGGIAICLSSPTAHQYAWLYIGGGSGQIRTYTQINKPNGSATC